MPDDLDGKADDRSGRARPTPRPAQPGPGPAQSGPRPPAEPGPRPPAEPGPRPAPSGRRPAQPAPSAPQPAPRAARRIGPYEQSLIDAQQRVDREAARRAATAHRRHVALAVVGVIAVIAVALGGMYVFTGKRDGSLPGAPAAGGATGPASPRSCDHPRTVTVAAPSGIAAALSAVTHALAARKDAPCAIFTITPSQGADIAASLGGKTRPDVWITDSPRWVQIAATSAGHSLTRATPFASSGLVVAMSPTRADALGNAPTWASVFGDQGGTRISAPGRSTTGLLALAAMKQALPGAQFGAVVASLSRQAAPTGLAQVAAATSPLGLVVTEAELGAYNAEHPGKPLAAVAPKGGAPAAEYALTVVSDDPGLGDLPSRLGDFLSSDTARTILAEYGLRTPGGPAPKPLKPLHGSVQVTAQPDAATLTGILDAWAAAAPKRQVLLALDVSGSIMDKIGDDTGLAVMTRSVRGALARAPDHLRISLWAHGLHIGNAADDFKRLTDYGAVSDPRQQQALSAGLDGLTKLVGGGSGLYDSILAAYTTGVRSFAADHVNTVAIVADGPNEDDYGLDLDGLKTKLAAAQDTQRPVHLVIIGFGSRPDAAVLREVTAITGGSYVAAPGPAELAAALQRELGAS